MISRIINKLLLKLLNNIITNNILILLNRDVLIKKYINQWEHKNYDSDKSPQENVGYSHIPEIQEYFEKSHDILKSKIKKYFSDNKSVLEIGCGTGLFLKNFPKDLKKTGQDLNKEFLKIALKSQPELNIIHGDFLKVDIVDKYDLITCIGVLMYIPPSKIDLFFDKIHSHLNENGKIYFQYSHALLIKDILYNDLSYVRYKPKFIENKIMNKFKIMEHKHFFDDRKISSYDKNRYYFPNGKKNRVDTIKNSYLLIAQKI